MQSETPDHRPLKNFSDGFYEALIETAEDLVYEFMIRLMVRRLEKIYPDGF